MKNELLVYKMETGSQMQVKTDGETVWLTQAQMCELFGRDQSVISKHIKNALREGEVSEHCNMQNLHIPNSDKPVNFYDLDIVISIGYRVKSLARVKFRKWATRTLKDYILNGVAVSSRFLQLADEMDRRFAKHDSQLMELRKDVDYFIRSSLPPKEKVFVDGQMLDAQVELTRIVKTAKKRIILIDNYIDERTLMLIGCRSENVTCTIYTLAPNSPRLTPALENYAKEFPDKPIEIKGYKKSHDRFLIIDDTVWHVGASLKDAGSALFALMKMELSASDILKLL